jgi:uncharacterized membrane protein
VTPAQLRLLASAALVALLVLCLAWELWLAPLRPGGSYLALKAAPLALPLYGILFGRRYTYQWSSMFVLLYFTEGVMRAWGDRGMSQTLAFAEAALSVIFFVAVVAYARATRPGVNPVNPVSPS